MLVLATMSAAVRMVISGNTTLRPMLGRRKPTSVGQQDKSQSDFPSLVKGISVLALIPSPIKISGNTILVPMPGHRKPTSGEQQDTVPSDFPSIVKGISVPATM